MAQTSATKKTTQDATKSKGKTKPSYKHVPHSQKPPHLVAKRNARERRRVQAVNQAFYKLRKCVPIENRNKRVSKVKTLQRAIDYIRKLERILAEDDDNNQLTSTSQVVNVVATINEQQQSEQLTTATTLPSTKRNKNQSDICDQQQQQQQLQTGQDVNQPQIIASSRQRKGRKQLVGAVVNKSHDLPVGLRANNSVSVCEAVVDTSTSRVPLSHCQPLESIDYHREAARQQQQAARFMPTEYFPNNNNNNPYTTTSEVLRESNAYNSNLNYTNSFTDQHNHLNNYQYHHNQYTVSAAFSGLNTGSSAGEPQVDETSYSQQLSSSYNNFHYTAVEPHSAAYNLDGHQGLTTVCGGYPATVALNGANETASAAASNTNWQQQRRQLTSLDDSTGVSSTTVDPLNSTHNHQLLSFALLQSSPSSSTNSSLTTDASSSSIPTSRSDNSSSSAAIVCGQATRGSSRQVNSAASNYLAYATAASNTSANGSNTANNSNRLDARVAHLSFAVNGSNSNNDNSYRPTNQQLDSVQTCTLKKTTATSSNTTTATTTTTATNADELIAYGNQQHQVRHLLNVGHHLSVGLSSSPLVNNLHDQQQQQQQQYHQHHQQSFPNNQQQQQQHHHHQLDLTHLSVSSQSGLANSVGTATAANNLIHQQAIQEYASLPL